MSTFHNQRAWDARVSKKDTFTQPAHDHEFADPLKTVDGVGWLGGNIRGQRLLCLAGGGGRQGPLYAAAGAEVTVVDISPAMLELDREVATQRKLNLKTVEASMDDLSSLTNEHFDIVIHPVSTCYMVDVTPIFREIARVTRRGGLYISQHKQPTSLQTNTETSPHGYELLEPYYRNGPLPDVTGSRHRESGTLEYLHRWEQLIGLMCRAGFVIEDLVEPLHAVPDALPGSFGHRSQFVAPYVRIKARRTSSSEETQMLWPK